jgi:hypothetical protein
MSIPNFILPYFLSLQEWIDLHNYKKYKKISETEGFLIIQNSKEDYIFNAIIKKLIRINIFDLSRISYLVILFLSPYIDPYLKEIINYDGDVSSSIHNRIYENEKNDCLPPLDKTICSMLNIVINQLISLELFLNINVFILYLNLHNYAKNNARIISNNIFLFKITQLVDIITNKIPNSTLSLLIMKTINKLGKIHNNYFSNDITANLEKEYFDSKMQEIVNNSRINNKLLDSFILQMMEIFESVNILEDSASMDADNFIIIWNTCKSHMINIMRNGIQLFKISLDILIIHLVKEQPDLKAKASCISNSIMNFLEMELDLLDARISI